MSMTTGWSLPSSGVVSRSFFPRAEKRTFLPLTLAFVTRSPVWSRTIDEVSVSTRPLSTARAESRFGPMR